VLLVAILYQDFRGYVGWRAAAVHHYFVWNNNLRKPEVGNFYLSDLFSPWVLFNEDVFRLKVSVHHSTLLEVVDGLDELIHYQSDFALLEFVSFDVFEQFSAIHLLHYYIHKVLILISLLHLNDVGVLDQLDDLNFLPQELLFPLG